MIHGDRHTLRPLVACAALALVTLLAWPADAEQVQLWNLPAPADAEAVESGDELDPLRIVAPRNGSFSAALAVESDEPITGLAASMHPPAGDEMALGEDDVAIHFAMPWPYSFRGHQMPRLDVMLETAPDEVPVHDDDRALVGVWVTVDVPAQAPPGDYRGMLHVEADGLPRTSVPIELTVVDWRVPPPGDWRTWIELIQSPDTLALEYDAELWSSRHWELIARSFQLISGTGSRVIYLPLLAGTNQGNEQSMVRWVRQADGSVEPDYTIVRRYLDLAEAHLGEPCLVVLYAWDAYLTNSEQQPRVDPDAPEHIQRQQRVAEERWALREHGVSVTVVDGETGEASQQFLPHFTDPASDEIWRPVFDELRRELRRRGLEDALALGMVTDVTPTREQTQFLHDVSGGLPWVAHRHPTELREDQPTSNRLLRGIADIIYEVHVYNVRYEVDPQVRRAHGWNMTALRAVFPRGFPRGGTNEAALRVRLLPEINVTGHQRGLGRLGADFWYVLEDRRGNRIGAVYERYPENQWRNLNIENWMLAPGPDGPVPTVRLQNLREGLQETEARIFLESVLLDDDRRSRLTAALADRVQQMLDERQRALWRSVWPNDRQRSLLDSVGGRRNARNPHQAIWWALEDAEVEDLPHYWSREGRELRNEMNARGRDWFLGSDWKSRNRQLFELAAEVQHALR